MKKKIIRITTVSASLSVLLKGQLNFMSNYFEIIGISSKGKYNILDDMFIKEGIRTVPIEMTRKITPIKDIVAVLKLYKVFKKEKPFIVHTHTPKAGTLGMLAAKLAGVPNRLHTIAGLPLLEATGLRRLLLNFVEKLTYLCATKIYPNSYGLKEIILEHKFTKTYKVKVLGNGSSNGIDTSYFDISLISDSEKRILKEKLEIKSDDFVFIFIGRLVKDKGINELIESFNKLSTNLNSIKLLLVGSAEKELDPLLQKTINIIDANPNIITTGFVKDVRPYLSISNALVFPSYREGFPNVVLQAGAMKLPSIVTNINGCNEIISQLKNGLIIPVKNPEALLDAMKRMFLLEKKERLAMGDKSRKLIVSNYEQQFVWNAILDEYNILCDI